MDLLGEGDAEVDIFGQQQEADDEIDMDAIHGLLELNFAGIGDDIQVDLDENGNILPAALDDDAAAGEEKQDGAEGTRL